MSIIQVTGTGFDSNVWGLVPDNDGTTCWAFQDTSLGDTKKYARFSLVDGSIVHAGNIFAGAKGLRSRTDAAVYWAQGDNGKYYVVSRGTPNFYQFEILPSAGGSGEVLDTYSTTLHSMTSIAPNSITAFTSGGVHYVALMSSTLQVINADTWTVVGTFGPDGGHSPSTAISGQTVFMDKFGDVWAITIFNQSPGLIEFFHWHPADGASGGTLNATVTYVPYSTVGFPGGLSNEPFMTHYVASNHSVLFSSEFGAANANFTADLCNLALGTPGDPNTFTQNTFFSSDGSQFISTFNYAYDATDMEMQNPSQPSGKLAIQSDTSGSEFNTQVGGIFNLLDPIALTVGTPLDVTQAIVAAGLTAPTKGTYTGHGTGPTWYNQFADFVYSETLSSLAVTYAQTDFSTGSVLYLITITLPLPTALVIGGPFVDVFGKPVSFGTLNLVISAVARAASTQIDPGTPITITLDVDGFVPAGTRLWANDALTPSGTYYHVSLNDKNGARVWGSENQQVLSTPVPFNMNSWVPNQ